MSGSFSGHLIDSFLSSQQQSRGPFGQNSPAIATYGPMAYAPGMHGTFTSSMQPSTSFADPVFMDLSNETAKRIATLQAKLDKKLGPEYISQRPGPGGGPKLTYAEGWKIINLANEVFGFNGWSSSVVNLNTDFIDCNEQTGRFTVGVTAVVRVMLRDGVFHEDVGYGMLENAKSKGAALDKCKKEAVTDGIKRTLRNFGNLLGNCLYDKQYTQEVIKIKVQPPKFDKGELHRRPEFDENKNNAGSSVVSTSSTATPIAAPTPGPSNVANIHPTNTNLQSVASASAVPPHMRAVSGSATNSNNATKVKSPLGLADQTTRASNVATSVSAAPPKTGYNTPPQTSAQNQAQQQKSNPPPSETTSRLSDLRVQACQPPAAPPPSAVPEKRVTFAQQQGNNASTPPVAPTESVSESFEDESFGLNSEDDDFFASVDLGEGLGGPIDFDEGLGGVESSIEDGPSVLGGFQKHRAAATHSYSNQSARTIQENQFPQRSNAQPSAPKPPQPPVHQSTSLLGIASNLRTSSQAGGFHFPPGMNNRLGSTLGTKRPADAMRDPARRPAQGMGLSHTGANSMRREPFAALDIGDGGDLKRVRR